MFANLCLLKAVTKTLAVDWLYLSHDLQVSARAEFLLVCH